MHRRKIEKCLIIAERALGCRKTPIAARRPRLIKNAVAFDKHCGSRLEIQIQ